MTQLLVARFRTFALALSLVALLASSSRAEVDYVIHISVDGLRSDILQNLVTTSPGTYPNFARLISESAHTFNARADLTITETIPNHLSMVTGRPVEQPAGQPNTVPHGYTNNFPPAGDTVQVQGNPNVPYKSSTFDVVHDNGLSTALYTSKTRLTILETSWNASYGAPDTIGADNGQDKIDFSMLVNNTSANIVNTLVTNMTTDPHDYSFLHITEPDSAGHFFGWTSATYATSLVTVDSRLGQLLTMIDTNPTLNDHTALVISADHGGGGDPVGGPIGGDMGHFNADDVRNYTIPFFVWGSDLSAGNIYDVLSNRFDPADERPNYDNPFQPLWNGDGGNLSLALLGLPSIPGSTLIPNIEPVPEPATVTLVLTALALVPFLRRKAHNRGR
jgi:hypothetical protein